MTSSLLIFLNLTNELHVGLWKLEFVPTIPKTYDDDPDLHRGDYMTNLHYGLFDVGEHDEWGFVARNSCDMSTKVKLIVHTTMTAKNLEVDHTRAAISKQVIGWKTEEVKRDTCDEVGSDFEGRDVIIIVAGCKHQVRDFKVAWNLFSTKEMAVASVNIGENSSLVVDDDLAELRTIPFEEGGDDTCTDKVQGWFWLNGSWDVWVVVCWTLLAIIAYTTKDYLNLFNTYYLLQVICKVDKHFMLVYGCMMHDCMMARYMGRIGCKMTWKDYVAIDVAKTITKVICLDDKAGVG